MAQFLLARLYGPLCSWGGPAVGELRPTRDHPTRSAVLGLVGACLGLRREDAVAQATLARSYGLAVRVDAPGRRRDDYHTVQAPKARKGLAPATRRAELAGNARDLETMVTRRSYLEDAVFTIALTRRSDAGWSLEAVAEAMHTPRFQPYLGRKSCPLAVPLAPVLSLAEDLPGALADADEAWKSHPFLTSLLVAGRKAVVWDEDVPTGALQAQTRSLRRDQPVDRDRWQFMERMECAALTQEGGA